MHVPGEGAEAITDGAGQPLAGGDQRIDFELDTSPPQITSVTPSDQSQLNSALQQITVTFSEAMDPGSFTSDHISLARTAPDGSSEAMTPGDIAFSSAGTQATLSFDQPLPDGAYTLELKTRQSRLAIGSDNGQNELRLFDLETGGAEAPIGSSENLPITDVAFAEGGLYILDTTVGTSTGAIHWLESTSGQLEKLGEVNDSLILDEANLAYSPAQPTLYVNHGKMSVFDPATGEDLGRITALDSVNLWTHAVSRKTGVVYTLSGSGTVHSYDPQTQTLSELGTMPLPSGAGFDGGPDDLTLDDTNDMLYGASSRGHFEMGAFDLKAQQGRALNISPSDRDVKDIAASDGVVYAVTGGAPADLLKIDPQSETYTTIGSVDVPVDAKDDLVVHQLGGLTDRAGNPVSLSGGSGMRTVEFAIDTTPPQVESVNPANDGGAESVEAVTINFSEPINPDTFSSFTLNAFDFDGNLQGDIAAGFPS